jgi:phosphoribosylglycinamide formyltransferase-1
MAVLASGRGSNLQALLDAVAEPGYPAEVAMVLSDNPEGMALKRARQAGVGALFVDPSGSDYEERLSREIESAGANLVCCAGYMRILSPAFVRRFAGKIINIHPSLLPSFPGLRAQRKAIRAGVRVSGCTVHFIDEGVDSGPIILQAAVPVLPDDDEDTLSERILGFEHRLYPLAVQLIAEGKIRLEGKRVLVADEVARNSLDGFISPNVGSSSVFKSY